MSEAGGPTPGVVTSAGGDSDRFPQPSWAISSYHPRSAGEEAEAQPVPLLVGPPRPPRASCLCAARPSLRPEETPARAELTVGQQGRALPGAPAAALPGPGMGVGYELGLRGQHQLSRWRPLGHDADLPLLDVPSSSLFLPPAPVVFPRLLGTSFLWPIIALRRRPRRKNSGTKRKTLGREEDGAARPS